jgi:hypothetical protein
MVWATQSTTSNTWRSVCWSPKHKLFVAVASGGNTNNRVMISSDGKTWTPKPLNGTNLNNQWYRVIWCPELEIFVAISIGFITTNNTFRVMYSRSSDASIWSPIDLGNTLGALSWWGICWSPELGMFVAVAIESQPSNIMSSRDGIIWSEHTSSTKGSLGVCWSSELGLFVAVGYNGANQRIMTSDNGKTWISITQSFTYACYLFNVCWCSELKLFVAIGWDSATTHTYALMTSHNGKIWNQISVDNVSSWGNICWSPELGIFVIISFTGGATRLMTSSLQGRPPTSYNVFDSSFNSIDESGNWSFSNISITGNIEPFINLSGSLGSSANIWSNAYIRDLSVSNISVSGNITICGSPVYTKTQIDASFVSKQSFDTSYNTLLTTIGNTGTSTTNSTTTLTIKNTIDLNEIHYDSNWYYKGQLINKTSCITGLGKTLALSDDGRTIVIGSNKNGLANVIPEIYVYYFIENTWVFCNRLYKQHNH